MPDPIALVLQSIIEHGEDGSMTERTVRSRWDGGLRAVVRAGDFDLVVDEPESAGGTGRGPQPTDLLLASVASCFTLALAYSADRRGVRIEALEVDVTGRYDGPRFDRVRIIVRAAGPQAPDLAKLITAAERVCYVTRTLRDAPAIDIDVEIASSGTSPH
jgi:putative redox protein